MLLLLFSGTACVYVSRVGFVEFNFKGTASGGTLIIGDTLSRNARFASVETYQGESADSVINKLAEEIVYNSHLFGMSDNVDREEQVQQMTSGGKLRIVGCPTSYFITGTETGLGIPKSPKFLSCRYDKENKKLYVKWINPSEDYDNVFLILNWNTYDSGWKDWLPGNAEEYVVDRNVKPYDIDDLDIWVIGYKDGLPSGPTTITLSDNGTSQQELCGIPFDGIMPNWEAWSLDTAPNIENIECNIDYNLTNPTKKGKRYNPIKTNDAKPFRQVLKTGTQGGTLGIWRKFLGLIPGHTYKLSARLSTLEMSPNDTEWGFSIHAVADKPGKKELTSNQMAGLEVLPNGKTGPQAGRIAEFGPGKLTAKNEYVIRSADITLPADSDSITVWLRHTGKGTSGVGFDWIKLEDLGVK